jgi:hypothetical protein
MYIAIRKIREDENAALYSFGVDDVLIFRAEIVKKTGNVRAVEHRPGDASPRIFSRVAHKLRQHWEKGEYPDSTCWAT